MLDNYEDILKNAPLGATHWCRSNEHYYQVTSEKEVYIFRLGLGEWDDSIMLFEELDDKDRFLKLNFNYDVESVKPLPKTVDITINLCQQDKPPLGLKPEYIFSKELEDMTQQMKEARWEEVLQACLRYCDNDMVIPRAWIVELESLRKV